METQIIHYLITASGALLCSIIISLLIVSVNYILQINVV